MEMTGSWTAVPRLNLAFAWVWILLGFLSGALLGLRFKEDRWLGGYGGFRRRLYRLGHISFFGLGLVNFLFAMTLPSLGLEPQRLATWAGHAFLTGGLLMPACCLVMAHFEKAPPVLVFAAPVSTLLLGGSLTLHLILKP